MLVMVMPDAARNEECRSNVMRVARICLVFMLVPFVPELFFAGGFDKSLYIGCRDVGQDSFVARTDNQVWTKDRR